MTRNEGEELQKGLRTYVEGVWGCIACQKLHCLWVKPEPKSHSQHQQARQLRNDEHKILS